MKKCQVCDEPIYDLTRKKFCSDKCMLANRKKLNEQYWANREIPHRTCRRCHKTVQEAKMTKNCRACIDIMKAPKVCKKKCATCDTTLTHKGLTYCPTCRESRRTAAYKKQSGARKEHALAIKHGLVTKPVPEGEELPSKFTTRGKIRYEGYREL